MSWQDGDQYLESCPPVYDLRTTPWFHCQHRSFLSMPVPTDDLNHPDPGRVRQELTKAGVLPWRGQSGLSAGRQKKAG